MTTQRQPAASLVQVKDSGIHGKGLFAAASIPADTLLLTIEGRPTAEDGTYVIWETEEDGTPAGFLITNEARYVNHARDANAAFFGRELWSLRPIRKGEEITHHYGPDWDDLD